MQYIDLKENLINQLDELKKIVDNKEILNKELILSKQVDNILKIIESVDISNIDTDIHDGILKLDILLKEKFNNPLFSNDENLLSVFSYNIKELYFKSELSLNEIFDEFQLSIRIQNNISNLEFEVYGYKHRLEEINKLINNELNHNSKGSSSTEGGTKNDRELYSR